MNSLARDISVNIAPCASYLGGGRLRQAALCLFQISVYDDFSVCQEFLFICAIARAITGTQCCAAVELGGVQGAVDTSPPFVQNVRVDHGRFDAGMSQQFLYGADVVAVGQQCVANEWRNVWPVTRLPPCPPFQWSLFCLSRKKTKRRELITDYLPPDRRCAGSMILPGIHEETAGG